MKIIREGVKPTTTKRFECSCGCIWEADKGEYKVTSQLGMMYGMKQCNMVCPCCGYIVDTD